MVSSLPIDVRDLLHHRGVESSRVELKESWNEHTTGIQVIQTVCAFANDVQNLNGGYIVIGVAEDHGAAVLPPRGLSDDEVDGIQKWIRGNAKSLLSPEYQPVLSPERVDGKLVLVVWAPGSDHRPHQAPERRERGAARQYFVRLGSETVKAEGSVLRDLLEQAAKIPFDHRRAHDVPVAKIRGTLVREFLADVGSGLVAEPDDLEIFRRMFLTARVNGHEVPRNVALLFFTDDPEEHFRGARIEVVQFRDEGGGDTIEERVFKGPLHRQLRDCLTYLRNLSMTAVRKQPDRPEASAFVTFPFPAFEEALVNAVYHRSYEAPPEPVKVYLYPDRMQITSYPGPVLGLELAHFARGAKRPPVPARNKRIGELLKELKLAEGRFTGIPKVYEAMRRNGSPEPDFDFDASRSYFTVTLPAHPEYVALSAIRDAALLDAIGDRAGARARLVEAFDRSPQAGALAIALIERLAKAGLTGEARAVFDKHAAARGAPPEARVISALVAHYLDADNQAEAEALLKTLPAVIPSQDAIDLAIQARRAHDQERAHQLFERAGDLVYDDARALLEFAQTKLALAREAGRRADQRIAQDKLRNDAKLMLERVLQLPAPPIKQAWAWYELGRVRRDLGAPESTVREALQRAVDLHGSEPRFREELSKG